jgi:dihydroneopterin aldolase
MKAALTSPQASDAILVNGLELSAHIGVPDAERVEAQRLTLNLVLLPSSPLSDLGDDLGRTVDYYALTRRVWRSLECARSRWS